MRNVGCAKQDMEWGMGNEEWGMGNAECGMQNAGCRMSLQKKWINLGLPLP